MANVPVLGRIVGDGVAIVLTADAEGEVTGAPVATNTSHAGAVDVVGEIDGAGSYILITAAAGDVSYSAVSAPALSSSDFAPVFGSVVGGGTAIVITFDGIGDDPEFRVEGGVVNAGPDPEPGIAPTMQFDDELNSQLLSLFADDPF